MPQEITITLSISGRVNYHSPHDIHPSPISQSAAVNAKDVLTEHYIQSLCSTAIKDVSI